MEIKILVSNLLSHIYHIILFLRRAYRGCLLHIWNSQEFFFVSGKKSEDSYGILGFEEFFLLILW